MSKDRKVKNLFEQSMATGGLPEFRKNWEQSLGILTDEDTGAKSFNKDKREIDYRDFEIGRVCQSLLGNDWRTKFEQNWMVASNLRFEGQGSTVLPGDLPYVSAAIDSIAGLANARALERPQAPQFIWDKMCEVQEASGEGGFETIIRPNGDKPNVDLADGQSLPTVMLKGSRVHRNRTLNQGLRTKVNLYTVLDDLTGTLYQAVDEVSDQVLNERERKVADMCMGIGATSAAALANGVYMVQDGSSFYPFQAAKVTTPSPQNQALIQNYINASNGSLGPINYTVVEQAIAILAGNRDPFTNLPVVTDPTGMTLFCSPATKIQMEYLLMASELWKIGSVGLTTAAAVNTISSNPLSRFGFNLVSSQIWANRLIDVGIPSQAPFTDAPTTDTVTTAGSVRSFWMMGHFKQAVKYWQRMPYTVIQVPLGSIEYSEQTVLIQDVRERGQAYMVNPRKLFRAYQ